MRLTVAVAMLALACKRETVAVVPDTGIAASVVTSDPPEPYYVPTDPPLEFDERIPGDDPIHRATRGKCRPDPCSKDVYVTLLVHVSPSGQVDRVTIEKGDPTVGACLAKLARKAHFAPSATGGDYAVPYIYKCDGAGSYDHGKKQNL